MEFYANAKNLINFSTAVAENPFGSQLLQVCENYYPDVETAVAYLSEGLQDAGFEDATEELIMSFMIGEDIPSESALEILLTLTEDDDRETKRLVQGYYLAEAMFEGEDEDEEDEENEGTSAEYDENEVDEEDESEPEVSEVNSSLDERLDSHQDVIQEMYTRQVVTDSLIQFSDIAQDLVARQHMTPHQYKLLLGESAQDRYANFSRVCESEKIDPTTQIDRIAFTLSFLENSGPVHKNSFANFSMQEDSVNFSRKPSKDKEVKNEVQDMYNLYRGVVEKE